MKTLNIMCTSMGGTENTSYVTVINIFAWWKKKPRKAEDNLIYTPDGADISSFDFEFDGKNTSKFTLSPAGKRPTFSYGDHKS